jgi:hypothetical protein
MIVKKLKSRASVLMTSGNMLKTSTPSNAPLPAGSEGIRPGEADFNDSTRWAPPPTVVDGNTT